MTGFVVVIDGAARYVATVEAAADVVLSGAGRCVTVINLNRLGTT